MMTPAEEMLTLRKKLFGLIIPDTKGMRLSRAYHFLRRQGIPITPWIAVGSADRERFTRACFETGLINKNIFDPKLDGISLYSLQFSIVFRGTPPEQQLGSKYAESTLIHEEVHGSGSLPEYLVREPSGKIVQDRLGLICNDKGHYLEESLADVIQQIYIEAVFQQQWEFEQELPSAGMWLLLDRDHRLFPALKRAHLGGPLGPVEKLIDAQGGTGLFRYLYNLPPGKKSVIAGNAAILDSLSHPGRRIFAV